MATRGVFRHSRKDALCVAMVVLQFVGLCALLAAALCVACSDDDKANRPCDAEPIVMKTAAGVAIDHPFPELPRVEVPVTDHDAILGEGASLGPGALTGGMVNIGTATAVTMISSGRPMRQ